MDYWEKANHSWSTDSLRYINTSTQKQRELFYYIQEIGYFEASKPYFTERENLPSYLIKYTLSGCGELRYKGKSYQLKAGDVFFIDCLDYQYYRTVSQEPWEMDWIHLYGTNVAAFYEEFLKNGSPVFHTNPASSRQNPIHLRQGITLESLEERYHINKYQIVKEFSKYMGLPPIEYQISKRISYSKDLLRYSRLSIKEISLAIGIENTAYFSRLFKKKVGISPSDYRQTENGR